MRQIFGGEGYVDIRQRLWVCNTIEAGKNTPGHFGPEGVVFLQSSVFAKRKISQHDTLYRSRTGKKILQPTQPFCQIYFLSPSYLFRSPKILALLCDKQTPIPPYTPPNPPRSLLPPQRLKKKILQETHKHTTPPSTKKNPSLDSQIKETTTHMLLQNMQKLSGYTLISISISILFTKNSHPIPFNLLKPPAPTPGPLSWQNQRCKSLHTSPGYGVWWHKSSRI